MRCIENYKNMLKEELLNALLKSGQSMAELRRSEVNNAEREEIKKIVNALRNNFSKEKIKRIRRKFRKKRRDWQIFKRTRKKNSLKETRKMREKTLHQWIKKGWRVFKKITRRRS